MILSQEVFFTCNVFYASEIKTHQVVFYYSDVLYYNYIIKQNQFCDKWQDFVQTEIIMLWQKKFSDSINTWNIKRCEIAVEGVLPFKPTISINTICYHDITKISIPGKKQRTVSWNNTENAESLNVDTARNDVIIQRWSHIISTISL